MGIKNWFIQRHMKGVYEKMSNDKKTTALGIVLGALIAVNVDYVKLLNADPTEIGKSVGAVVTALLGWYTNRPDKKK